MFDDTHLISVGGKDNSIMIWETDFGSGNVGVLEDYDDESDDEEVNESDFIQPKK